MKRGHRRALPWLLLATTLACSGSPPSGPVEPVWDRDACERCRMTLSDPRFAAQIRMAHDGRVRHFDDLGCALLWLDEERAGGREAREFFVHDTDGEGWLEADRAAFRSGQHTPMGFGFGASSGSPEGATLEEVAAAVRRMEDERRRAGQ